MLTARQAVVAIFALMASCASASGADVVVMAGSAMSGPFSELLPQFERASGHKIVIQYGATGSFQSQIEAGQPVDLVIFGSAGVDDLIKKGKAAADTRVDIARIGVGIAVREGAPKPDIQSVEGLRKTLLGAKSITFTPGSATGPDKIIAQLGITEQLKDKIKHNPPDKIAVVVAAGDAELAIGNVPSLLSAKGVQMVGLVPAELQNWFVNTAAVSTSAKQPEAAKALIKHLTSPEAAAAIKAKGMEALAR